MGADKMPPLPAGREFIAGTNRHFAKVCGTVTAYIGDDMHAYARAYAAEQTRELVEALESIADCCDEDHAARDYASRQTEIRGIARTLIAKHKGAA